MLAFSGLSPALPSRLRTTRTCAHPRTRTIPLALDPAALHHATALLDPSILHAAAAAVHPPVLQHVTAQLVSPDALHAASMLLADAAAAVAPAADAAVEAKKAGWWDSFVNLVEGAVVSLHSLLDGAGVPGAYGLSIILFTVAVKAITFPLNFKQMESTIRMQALAPRLKKIQNDYKDNPSVLNQMTAQLYKDEQINPLAGCAPVLAQIPVWIALYRAVLNLASDNLLNEAFLWIPSLQGPVSKTGQGLDTWLFPLVNGAPPIGWHDAACYLVLPLVLVASQFYSQKLIAPPSSDPQQQTATKFLKFMPLLIGWFSLNVPSGLGIYWVTNNLLSTGQTVFIRSRFPDLIAQASAPVEEDDNDSTRSLDMADGFRKNATDGKSPKPSKAKKRRKRR